MPTDPAGPSDHKETQERFLRLLLPLRDRLAQFARAMTRNREEADDLVSDTILAALERFDTMREEEAFLSYLFTIAVRIHRRRRWRARLFGSYDEERAEQMADGHAGPDRSADVAMLHRAMERLPERQREAVALFELSDLSLEEIRSIQGGSLSGVKSRIVRGRRKLAELLGAAEMEGGRDPSRNGAANGRESNPAGGPPDGPPDGATNDLAGRPGPDHSPIDMHERQNNAYLIYTRTRSHG